MRDGERWKIIYNQINGLNEPDVCEWVKDETSMEGALGPLVEEVYKVRNLLCERLGLNPSADPDLEQLISGFENLSRACGKLMYYYGYQDGAATK